MKKIFILVCLSLCLFLSSCGTETKKNNKKDYSNVKAVIVIKGFGEVTVKLDHDNAPITVEHFIKLALNGDYDNVYINRCQKGFVLQAGAGCKNSETIKGEFRENGVENNILHDKGVISMARTSGPDSASSQFFIVLSDSESCHKSLDNQYAGFGKIVEGFDVIDKICLSIKSTDYENSYNGIVMGFLDSSKYIVIETIKIVY